MLHCKAWAGLAPEPGGPEDQAPSLEPTHPARRVAWRALWVVVRDGRADACAICGRPMQGHPRCPVCGLLVGPGHEYAEICYDCRRWATVVGRQRLAAIAQRRASQVVVA